MPVLHRRYDVETLEFEECPRRGAEVLVVVDDQHGGPHPRIVPPIASPCIAASTDVDPAGLPIAFAGGIGADATLVLEQSVVSENVVRAVSAGDAVADGGGLEVAGTATIRDTLIARNSVVAEEVGGALAQGGGIATPGS